MIASYVPSVNPTLENSKKSRSKPLPKPRPVQRLPRGDASACRVWEAEAVRLAEAWAAPELASIREWVAAGCEPSDDWQTEAIENYQWRQHHRSKNEPFAKHALKVLANKWRCTPAHWQDPYFKTHRERFKPLVKAARLMTWARGCDGKDETVALIWRWLDCQAFDMPSPI